MSPRILNYIVLFLALLVSAACTPKKPTTPEIPVQRNRKSPIAISSISKGETYIKIVYGQPYRRGRTIFGDWEPYGSVWRTGANEATEITFTKPVLFGNKQIDAGTYSLFTIPNEKNWTVILNFALGLWGAFDYNSRRDYVRVDVPVTYLNDPVEVLDISFDNFTGELTHLRIKWDVVEISVPIRIFEM